MIPIRSEKLFQLIIGPGQIWYRIAGKESWPVTAGNLPEVRQRWGQSPCGSLVARHRAQESPKATLYGQGLALVLVTEDVGRLMNPAIPHTYIGPQRSRVD